MKEKDIIDLIEDEELRAAIIQRRQLRKGERRPPREERIARTCIEARPETLAKIRVIAATRGESLRKTIIDALDSFVAAYEAEKGEIEIKQKATLKKGNQ